MQLTFTVGQLRNLLTDAQEVLKEREAKYNELMALVQPLIDKHKSRHWSYRWMFRTPNSGYLHLLTPNEYAAWYVDRKIYNLRKLIESIQHAIDNGSDRAIFEYTELKQIFMKDDE